ncbi:MAG: FHA domain-containing protein, partial [Planctomycetota bacterium]
MPTFLLKPVGGIDAPPATLGDRPIAIGRHPDNDIPIRDDLASRFHCVIEPCDGGFRVRDLGSRNGTKVNEERVEVAVLKPGDVVAVGGHAFRVVAKGAASGGRAPKPRPADPARTNGGRARAPGASSAGRPSGGAPPWAKELASVIRNLPPKEEREERVRLIDADGRESAALSGEGAGALAARMILLAASKSHATDIHIEPRGEHTRVRVRSDGQMVTLTQMPPGVGERVLALFRTACQLKTAPRDAVLDGHFSARFTSRRVDYRASFTPSVHGQKLVLRVLDLRDAPTSLFEIGMPRYMVDRVRKTVHKNQGMMLVCGPTGSGKTTTLYQGLREIDRERRNVVTIEDPVEYRLEGVTQIPADLDRGNTFGALLRSVLRQDPDVIFVGEIRDEETAQVAMQAAMTGHLVFSTVHAKDTMGAVFRLLDLNVERHLVANALDLVLAQRLVRRLCDSCKRPVRVTPGQAMRLGRYLNGADQIYAATGCARCLRTGYRGRKALFELLSFNDELRDAVLNNPTIATMKKIIEQDLFTTLLQSGLQMVARGETSLDEVERVVG